MSKTILVSVSDDRFGRKEGAYGKTQDKLDHILGHNPNFGIIEHHSWTIKRLLQYYEGTTRQLKLLDNPDAGRNGRAYKPLAILASLQQLNDGDFLIYTDCSPEMWTCEYHYKIEDCYNLDIAKQLCVSNNDILTSFVKWSAGNVGFGELGDHTHRLFTLDRCMRRMKMMHHIDHYQHASGMFVIRKTPRTVQFVDEWLYWNLIDECASLGKANDINDYSFINEECWENGGIKLGHRHDQSISGLLINDMGNKLVDIHYKFNGFNPYNPLQFMRTDITYDFIDPNTARDIKDIGITIGSQVFNAEGAQLTVFGINTEEDGRELIVVGKHRASCYKTERIHLKLKQPI